MSTSGVSRPARLEFQFESIPDRIRSLNRWVVWRCKKRKKSRLEPPLQVVRSSASVDHPGTWPMSTQRETHLSLPGLASSLRVPKEWLKAEADAGRIPQLRVGQRYRPNRDAVLRTIAERSAIGGEEARNVE
jgi:hypothetical protein